jgi:hypothetical protein
MSERTSVLSTNKEFPLIDIAPFLTVDYQPTEDSVAASSADGFMSTSEKLEGLRQWFGQCQILQFTSLVHPARGGPLWWRALQHQSWRRKVGAGTRS